MARQTLTCRPLYRFGESTPSSTTVDVPSEWARSEAGWVTGRTVDEAGNPLPCAHIRIYLHDFESISDTSGFFLVTNIPAGEYMVMIEHEEYAIQFVPHVRVGGGGTSLETIRMEERILMRHEFQEHREYLE